MSIFARKIDNQIGRSQMANRNLHFTRNSHAPAPFNHRPGTRMRFAMNGSR
jgi:hypothetical protein